MKKGISLIVLVVAISVMMMIISSASVIGFNYIAMSNFEEYKSTIKRVEDEVNLYYMNNKELPTKNEVISFNSLGEDFNKNVISLGDEDNKLFLVDVNKLNNLNIKDGRGTVDNRDVYLVSENTFNVYYLKGFKYQGAVYFTDI